MSAFEGRGFQAPARSTYLALEIDQEFEGGVVDGVLRRLDVPEHCVCRLTELVETVARRNAGSGIGRRRQDEMHERRQVADADEGVQARIGVVGFLRENVRDGARLEERRVGQVFAL